MKLTSHLLRQQYNFQPFMFKIDLPTFANSNVISSICHHRCRCVFSQCFLVVSNIYKQVCSKRVPVVRYIQPFYKAILWWLLINFILHHSNNLYIIQAEVLSMCSTQQNLETQSYSTREKPAPNRVKVVIRLNALESCAS